jgi:hypothetical protein
MPMTRPASLAVDLGDEGSIAVPLPVLGWASVAALYAAVRLAVALNAPVAGAELWSLSGAWAAHAGADDARFTGALAQAIAAATFAFTDSALPARLVLALLGSVVLAVAAARLRAVVGDGPLLVAAALVALDPFLAASGGTASALALDVPVALLLFAVAVRPLATAWPWPVLAAAIAVCGPPPFLLALVLLAARLAAAQYPRPLTAALAAVGAIAGIAAASVGFGFRTLGLAVPPVDLFAASFDAEWSTGTAAELALLYGWPLLAAGGASAGWVIAGWARGADVPQGWQRLGLSWGGIGLVWLIAGAGSHAWAPVPAVSMPAALLAGAAAPRLWERLRSSAWRLAAPPLAAIAVMAASAGLFAFGWAFGRPNGSALLAILLVGGAGAMAALLAASRPTRPATFLVPLAFGFLWLVAMTGRAASPGPAEPLYSPAATAQGRVIRAAAIELADGRGRIAVHPDLVDDVTWPLRRSGTLLVTDRPPADAAVFLAPWGTTAPEGYLELEGPWAFLRLTGPPESVRGVLRWLASRNVHASRDEPVAMFARPTP